MIDRGLLALTLLTSLSMVAAQDQALPGSDQLRATSLYTAWLVDQLHADPARAIAAYRAVVEDAALPREERLVALARLLPLAAMRVETDPVDAARGEVSALLGRAAGEAADDMAQRLTAARDALREALRQNPANPDLDALTAAFERTRVIPPFPQGQRGSAWGGADTLPEVQRRMLRAAEERGDTTEAGRLRRLMAANAGESDGRTPRARQIQRWARDALESELDGQHDKAARLRANLALLRTPGRGPAAIADRFQRTPERMIRLTIERLQTVLETAKGPEPVTERERLAARRALAEAQRRHAAGDVAGAVALLWPAAVLLRSPD